MTTKRIVFSHPDGSVGIICPAPKDRRKFVDESSGQPVIVDEPESAWLARVATASVPPDATGVRTVDISGLPDRTFRDAWRNNGSAFTHDMEHARAIARSFIRIKRAPVLEDLDTKALRALEGADGGSLQAIYARKQSLRDATAHPSIDAAQTPDELKAAMAAVAAEVAA